MGCTNSPEQVETVQPTANQVMIDDEGTTAVPNPTATVDSEPMVTSSPSPPTATPLPPKVLTICISQLPENLYIYGDRSNGAQTIQRAI